MSVTLSRESFIASPVVRGPPARITFRCEIHGVLDATNISW
jgi:hypothetical protein